MGGRYDCICKEGFSGTWCEIDPCFDFECENDGRQRFKSIFLEFLDQRLLLRTRPKIYFLEPLCRCILDSKNQPNCACKTGYEGEKCEITPCERENLCENGGNCTDIETSEAIESQCICQEGYFGDFCEITPCSGKVCLNDGVCVIESNSYKCDCKER